MTVMFLIVLLLLHLFSLFRKRSYHDYLWDEEPVQPAPWSLSKDDRVRIDQKIHTVIGAKGDERPYDVVKKCHAKNTHDTIFWASTYASWTLTGEVTSS